MKDQKEHTNILTAGKYIYPIETTLLKKYARYFPAIFQITNEQPKWQEGATGVVDLELFGPQAVLILKHWMENQELTIIDKVIKVANQLVEQGVMGDHEHIYMGDINQKLELLLDCYVLGNYLTAPGFQNAVMDVVIDLYAKIYFEEVFPFTTLTTYSRDSLIETTPFVTSSPTVCT